jgi:hypothetical protein
LLSPLLYPLSFKVDDVNEVRTSIPVRKKYVENTSGKDTSMSVFILPFLLLAILLGALRFHDVRYQLQVAHAGKITKPML